MSMAYNENFTVARKIFSTINLLMLYAVKSQYNELLWTDKLHL
jgi:hypothetical protein